MGIKHFKVDLFNNFILFQNFNSLHFIFFYMFLVIKCPNVTVISWHWGMFLGEKSQNRAS